MKGWQQLPESSQITAEHVADLQCRLEHVAVLSHQRQVKLQLENTRYALLELLSEVEEHLKMWNQKFGFEPEVKNVLKEYQVCLALYSFNNHFHFVFLLVNLSST